MEVSMVVIRQTAIMMLNIAVGYILFRRKLLSAQGSKDIGNLLLWIVIPAVIINSFCIVPTKETVLDFALSAGLGALSLGIAVVVARLLFPRSALDNFAAAFANIGYMGIPLVTAVLGQGAVFYMIGSIAFLNVLQWTYGVSVITEGRVKTTAKNLFHNPLLVATLLGMVLFFSSLGSRIPEIGRTFISGLANLNGSIAMICLGVYLAQTDLKSIFSSPRLYTLSIVRLLLIPALTLGVLYLIPAPLTMKMTIFLAFSTPVGSNVAVYAQLHGSDYAYGCKTVALTTILSIITLPLVVTCAKLVFETRM